MAAADYRLCDVCDNKVFYDSNLNYVWGRDEYNAHIAPFRTNGEATDYMEDRHEMRLDYLGDWAVICTECAKTHKTIVVPIDTHTRGPQP
jgi:hypothetical protein